MELNERKMGGVLESPSVLREVGATSGAGPGGNHKGVVAAKAEGSTHSPPQVQGGFTEGFAVDACGEEDEEDEGAHGQVEDRGARDASRLPRRLARERFHRGRWGQMRPSVQVNSNIGGARSSWATILAAISVNGTKPVHG